MGFDYLHVLFITIFVFFFFFSSRRRHTRFKCDWSSDVCSSDLTDGDGELEAVAEAAKEAGRQWFFSGVLFLMPSSAKQFLPFVREKFPRLAKQYEQWYAKNGYAPEEYRKKASERVARIRQKFGFASRPWVEAKGKVRCSQMTLSWDTGMAKRTAEPNEMLVRSAVSPTVVSAATGV